MVLTLSRHLSLNQLDKNGHGVDGVVELGNSVVIFQLSWGIYLPLPLSWCRNAQVCICMMLSESGLCRRRVDNAKNCLVEHIC